MGSININYGNSMSMGDNNIVIGNSIGEHRKGLEIKSAMDLVVEKNIFAPNGGDIVATVEAKVVVTDTTEYDLVL